ncbi:hypothetical protein PR048_002168 [Dryococelus australis]|uniref:Uncharacterized protein n=1 Tax=Dryococelus australis TaxID=614101 RepID=A0ABQ9IJE4_9NEOP|nr:hypothetical protein PR048_002168 [Dryococelus australis]
MSCGVAQDFGPWTQVQDYDQRHAGSLKASHQDESGSIPGRITPDFRKWESYRTMPLVGEFSRGSPVSPPFHSGATLFSPHFTLIGSQDLIRGKEDAYVGNVTGTDLDCRVFPGLSHFLSRLNSAASLAHLVSSRPLLGLPGRQRRNERVAETGDFRETADERHRPGVTPQGIGPCSSRWEASSLTTTRPWPQGVKEPKLLNVPQCADQRKEQTFQTMPIDHFQDITHIRNAVSEHSTVATNGFFEALYH